MLLGRLPRSRDATVCPLDTGGLRGVRPVSSSRDREHDLASNVPTSGSFVRLTSIGKRKRAVDGDTNRTGIEQTSEFCELRAVRTHLGHRDRDAQLRGLLGVGEA